MGPASEVSIGKTESKFPPELLLSLRWLIPMVPRGAHVSGQFTEAKQSFSWPW